MANKQSNDAHPSYEATHLADGVAALADQDSHDGSESILPESTDLATSSAPVKRGPRSKLLSGATITTVSTAVEHTRRQNCGIKRLIKANELPEQRANLEALIKYYEDGGKIPEGQEEVWAFEGKASFGIRRYTYINQMPERCFTSINTVM